MQSQGVTPTCKSAQYAESACKRLYVQRATAHYCMSVRVTRVCVCDYPLGPFTSVPSSYLYTTFASAPCARAFIVSCRDSYDGLFAGPVLG